MSVHSADPCHCWLFQLIKNTIMEKHHSKEHKDNINLESQQLVSAMYVTREIPTRFSYF